MVKFPCTFCGANTDSSRDLVRMPRDNPRWWQISQTVSEYKCPGCGALHALQLRPRGVLAYVLASPALLLAAFLYAPESAAGLGGWLGRVAYKPVVVMPPNNSFKPKPLRGSA
jgi:predicted RNA-binding Zn-ribbon protein involved in translation (DUF1610 family)